MRPLIRTGQGTSQTIWDGGGYWHEPHTPPLHTRTVEVWLREEDVARRGFLSSVGTWVFIDDDGLPTAADDGDVIGWREVPPPAPVAVESPYTPRVFWWVLGAGAASACVLAASSWHLAGIACLVTGCVLAGYTILED